MPDPSDKHTHTHSTSTHVRCARHQAFVTQRTRTLQRLLASANRTARPATPHPNPLSQTSGRLPRVPKALTLG